MPVTPTPPHSSPLTRARAQIKLKIDEALVSGTYESVCKYVNDYCQQPDWQFKALQSALYLYDCIKAAFEDTEFGTVSAVAMSYESEYDDNGGSYDCPRTTIEGVDADGNAFHEQIDVDLSADFLKDLALESELYDRNTFESLPPMDFIFKYLCRHTKSVYSHPERKKAE